MVYDNYELDMKKKNTGHLLKIPQEGYVLSQISFTWAVPMNIRKNHLFCSDAGRPFFGGASRALYTRYCRIGGCRIFRLLDTGNVLCPADPYLLGVEICQIYFHTVLGEAEKYMGGKYQNNQGIQPSLLYKDFEK